MSHRAGKDRRAFLKAGILAAGSAAAGAAAGRALGSRERDGGRGGSPDSSSSGETLLALTTDGRLVRVADDGPQLPSGRTATASRQGVKGRKWLMVIDLAKCDGCKSCTRACSKMHFTPPDREWIKVFTMQDSEETSPYHFPKPCFHCDNPPCTKVCPVGATFKRTDGVVLIDNERCIGCRFCMAACPYSTRYFNWGRPVQSREETAQEYSPEHGYPRRIGTVEKCDFCPDMAERGRLPACVSTCAMGALYYGDENEDAVTNSKGETRRFSELMAARAGYRYLEHLGTHPRVYYLPPKQRMYPVPGATASGEVRVR